MKVTVVIGSPSDLSKVTPALEILKKAQVPHDLRVCSAHRTPKLVQQLVEDASTTLFIAAAGMTAALAGAIAAADIAHIRPVISLPLGSSSTPVNDYAALLTVQTPKGLPTPVVGLNSAENAALYAIQILALQDDKLKQFLRNERAQQSQQTFLADANLSAEHSFDPALGDWRLLKTGKVREVYQKRVSTSAPTSGNPGNPTSDPGNSGNPGNLTGNPDNPGNPTSNPSTSGGQKNPTAEPLVLLQASDRVSAFDKVLPVIIPQKGPVLTEISNFWFDLTAHLCPNAKVPYDPTGDPFFTRTGDPNFPQRCTVMKSLRMIPVEAIVRGYITGSLWEAYDRDGIRSFCGHPLPEGLQNSQQLPQPLFTPTTKAPVGQHDQNITTYEMVRLVRDAGFPHPDDLCDQIRTASLQLYKFASDYARAHGLILADTKFEFGLDETGALLLADELLTPDSSRYWPLAGYQPGHSQPSFDKQIIRDYLHDHPSATVLPPEIITQATQRYRQCLHMLTN